MLVRKPWNFVSDLSSAMIINCLAQDATIFSWVKQPLKKNKQKQKQNQINATAFGTSKPKICRSATTLS